MSPRARRLVIRLANVSCCGGITYHCMCATAKGRGAGGALPSAARASSRLQSAKNACPSRPQRQAADDEEVTGGVPAKADQVRGAFANTICKTLPGRAADSPASTPKCPSGWSCPLQLPRCSTIMICSTRQGPPAGLFSFRFRGQPSGCIQLPRGHRRASGSVGAQLPRSRSPLMRG